MTESHTGPAMTASSATYEDLAQIELDFEDVDTEIIAHQENLSRDIYAKRRNLIGKIPNFWPLVFEQAPPEIDQYIQPSDSAVFAACLTDLTVSRFEIPTQMSPDSSLVKDFGQPRSIAFRFEFAPNEWFENEVLEKRFWYRRAKNGWGGRVSEPVKINWKKGKDLTDGLLDAAVKMFEAEKESGVISNGASAAKGRGKGKAKVPKEYEQLKKRVDASTEGSQSFFTWFGYRGPHVSEAESIEATKIHEAKRLRYQQGKKGSEDAKEDEDDEEKYEIEERFGSDADIEVFPDGEELAISIAEDLWPSAIKYFVAAQEADDMSNSSFEDADMDDEDSSDGGEIPDIRSLVREDLRSGGQGGPPTKKRRI